MWWVLRHSLSQYSSNQPIQRIREIGCLVRLWHFQVSCVALYISVVLHSFWLWQWVWLQVSSDKWPADDQKLMWLIDVIINSLPSWKFWFVMFLCEMLIHQQKIFSLWSRPSRQKGRYRSSKYNDRKYFFFLIRHRRDRLPGRYLRFWRSRSKGRHISWRTCFITRNQRYGLPGRWRRSRSSGRNAACRRTSCFITFNRRDGWPCRW